MAGDDDTNLLLLTTVKQAPLMHHRELFQTVKDHQFTESARLIISKQELPGRRKRPGPALS